MVASKKKLKQTPKETSQNQIVHVIIASLNFALTQDKIQLDTCEELDKDANFIYLHIAKIGRYAVSLIPISRNIFFLILKKKLWNWFALRIIIRHGQISTEKVESK